MFNTKNPSPKQLSLFTALALSVPISLGIYIIKPGLIAAYAFVIIFIGSYSLIQFTLQRFIYRKLKLIYKFIHQTKATRKEETYYRYLLPKKSIDDVRQDVQQWAEQSNKEIETLKSIEVYRREFLQNLSHEFKTPIFAIQGYVDTLLDGALENPAVNRRFLENAANNIDRMVTLVNDLDEITKLESGEQTLFKRIFLIQDVIRAVYDSLLIKAEEKHTRFGFKKGCEQPQLVYADKEKISQVITNLVANAIKYGKQGGYVLASIYQTDDEHVLIEISDDGIGIAEAHLSRIFERFYRTDPGRSRNIGGTGLGLAICKHIIEAHGHTIHVRSKLDVGTTIGFTLEAKKNT